MLAQQNGVRQAYVARSHYSDFHGCSASLWADFSSSCNCSISFFNSSYERDDGTRQWAYKGQPLYTYAKDQKAGDMTGDRTRSGLNSIKTATSAPAPAPAR